VKLGQVFPRALERRGRSVRERARRIAGSGLDVVAKLLGLGKALEFLERLVLDLADPLARDVERAPDLVECARMLAADPVAQLEHAPLAVAEVSSASRSASLVRSSTARSYGDSAPSSTISWPNSDCSSSPTGFSSEIGACAERLIDSTSSGSTPAISAISSTVGSRPSPVTSLRSARPILSSLSTMWTGIRIVRALSASARAIAWRIHQVAYVEN
jgi:hypothetical protein